MYSITRRYSTKIISKYQLKQDQTMNLGKKCCCFYAALVSFAAIFLITYFAGYSMNKWTLTTWLAVIITVNAAGFCLWCRQKEDEHSGEH